MQEPHGVMDKGKGAGGERWEGRGVRERGKVGGREKLLVGRHRNPNRNRTAKIKRKNRNTKTAKGDKGSISPTDWSFVAGLKHPVKNDQPGWPRRKERKLFVSFSPRPTGRDSAGWPSSANPEARPLDSVDLRGLGVLCVKKRF